MALVLTDLADQVVKLYGPAFVTAIKTKSFVLSRFEAQGLVRGGKPRINWQVNYAGNTSVGSYAEGDTADGSGKQSYHPAALEYKSVKAEIGLGGLTLATSEQGGTFIDMLRAELDNGVRDMRLSIEAQLLSDGSGNSAKDITGVYAAIAETGTYAGIDRSTHTWWKSYINDNSATPRNLSEALIADVVDEVISRGADQAALEIWASPTQWRNFGALYKGERRQTPTRLSGGYMALDFEGVPVIRCPGYASTHMDVVDVSRFSYEMLPVTANSELARSLRNVVAVPGMPGFGILLMGNTSDALEMWLIHYAQLVCSNPYVQGSITDLA
jgi:hypothetical protein